MSRGHKQARYEKEYLSSNWTLDTKIQVIGGAGRDLSVHEGILKYSNFWPSYNMLKKYHNRSLYPMSHRNKLDDEIWSAGGNYL